MSWTNELYQVYENFHDQTEFPVSMVPIYHSSTKVQIEISIREDGEFSSARRLTKEEELTVLPVTEDSGARSSGIAPMPFTEKLIYLAADYAKYVDAKRAEECHKAYMEQLKDWDESDCTHPAVHALLLYLQKGSVMQDLIHAVGSDGKSVLKWDESSGELGKDSINGVDQGKAFVRFRIHYTDMLRSSETWNDTELQDAFIRLRREQMQDMPKRLCYATGEDAIITYKHPSKIVLSSANARLISANDDSGFTYRGRFSDKEEAFAIGYEYSQKVHNALKWLIALQPKNPFCDLSLVIWSSTMQELPSIYKSALQLADKQDEDEDEDEEDPPTIGTAYADMVHQMIYGYRDKMEIPDKVMVLGLEASTEGRVSIPMYAELKGSQFLENLEYWHLSTGWKSYYSKAKDYLVNSVSPYDVILCAHGVEQNGKLTCKSKLFGSEMLQLLPCIIYGKHIPSELVQNLTQRASAPLAFDPKFYNHNRVLKTACALIRKQELENHPERLKGANDVDKLLDLDKTSTDRSYLFGRLLAVADKLERDTFDMGEDRVTNAKRLWNMFSVRPYYTWGILRGRLIPYINKLGKKADRYQIEMQEISSMMSPEVFSSTARLSSLYLLGYDHEMKYLFTKKEKLSNDETAKNGNEEE